MRSYARRGYDPGANGIGLGEWSRAEEDTAANRRHHWEADGTYRIEAIREGNDASSA